MMQVNPPCSRNCNKHTACIEAIEIASTKCVCCKKYIGYGNNFHAVPNGYMHYVGHCDCVVMHGVTNVVDRQDGTAIELLPVGEVIKNRRRF